MLKRIDAKTMRWNEDVGKKIDEYVKAGTPEKVRSMFMLDSPETVLGPMTKDGKLAYLETYVNSTPAKGLAENAAIVRQQDAAAFLTPGETLTVLNPQTADEQWKALPPGAPFRDPRGNLRRKAASATGNRSCPTRKPSASSGPRMT